LGNEIKEDEMGDTCSKHGKDETCTQYLVGEPVGKKPLGRIRHRWEDNIRMDLREIRGKDVDWMHLVQDRKQ
jgi:hypothetical protein